MIAAATNNVACFIGNLRRSEVSTIAACRRVRDCYTNCTDPGEPFMHQRPRKTRRKARKLSNNGPPLIVVLGRRIAENLTLILGIAFLGAVALVLDNVAEHMHESVQRSAEAPEPAGSGAATEDDQKPQKLLAEEAEADRRFDERVEHYRRCTFGDYREQHFDECVQKGSRVYKRPYREGPSGNTA